MDNVYQTQRLNMTDLVSEMQAKALEQNTSITNLLRTAKIVAVKLDLDESLNWISELGGYESLEVPPYRVLKGEMKARETLSMGTFQPCFPTMN
jgi:hypothetical protein